MQTCLNMFARMRGWTIFSNTGLSKSSNCMRASNIEPMRMRRGGDERAKIVHKSRRKTRIATYFLSRSGSLLLRLTSRLLLRHRHILGAYSCVAYCFCDARSDNVVRRVRVRAAQYGDETALLIPSTERPGVGSAQRSREARRMR